MEWVTTSTILDGLGDYQNRVVWQRFVERFRIPVVRFATSLGLSATDAEDVAQETLVAFAESYRSGRYDRSKGRLSRWLFGIAFRQVLRQRRRGAREPVVGAGEQRTGFLQNLPDERRATANWEHEWEQHLLAECLEQVRREFESSTYEAFERVMKADKGAADVAREMNVSVKLVYNAKHRVLKRLRELREDLESID